MNTDDKTVDKSVEEALAALSSRVDSGQATQTTGVAAIRKLNPFEANVKDIRMACNNNPNHPLSGDMLRSVAQFPDNHKVTVDRICLQGILVNKEVIETSVTKSIDGVDRVIITSRLGNEIKLQPETSEVSETKRPETPPTPEPRVASRKAENEPTPKQEGVTTGK